MVETTIPVHDPYTVREGEAMPAPTTWKQRLRHLGPSIVIAGSIVGSGEIILTASLGAAVGFALFWWVLLSCWVKSLTQAELSRYVLVSGDTYQHAMNRLPFKLPGPKGPVAWPLYLFVVAQVPGIMGLGGIVGGAGQALNLLFPGFSAIWATAFVALLCAVLLVSGSYRLLERVMLTLVLSFTFATLVCAITMQFTEYGISGADLVSGFSFEFPAGVLVLALSVYGYTGVNSGEISAYTFWCIEKGYPSRIGPSQAPGWEERAKGWIKVLQADVWVTLLILTLATIPFYVLGAGVLHALGERPEGTDTISALSNMFTHTLGPWAVWLFAIGAFCILFSTTLAGFAGQARYIADLIIELGFVDRSRIDFRKKFIRFWCVGSPFLAFGFYLWIQNPVLLVIIGALTAALFLPLQTGAVLWLQANVMDQRVRPRPAIRFALWGIFVFEAAMALLVVRYVVF